MKKTIGIFFGGQSVEHEISVISTMEAWKHFDENCYNLIPIYISKEGLWYTGKSLLNLNNYGNLPSLLKSCSQVYFKMEKDFILYEGLFKKIKLDCCFPIIHGSYGEDGSLQGLFHLKKIPYVGSSILSSALSIDKIMTKKLLKAENIPVVEGIEIYKKDFFKNLDKNFNLIEKMNYPLIVKPYNLGSSVGIQKVKNKAELDRAIAVAFEYSTKILIEKALENFRELNCAVLGSYPKYTCSAIEEVFSSGELLSYEDKYLSKQNLGMVALKRELPAKIDQNLKEEIENLSLKVAKLLNLGGVARIDFLYADHKIYLCEVNTIPGSLSFFLWKDKNISFKELLNRMIQYAFEEHDQRNELYYDHSINLLKNFKKSSKLKV